jgi:uncharacterized membrane-anchored protein YhcB (DUF1043 family)
VPTKMLTKNGHRASLTLPPAAVRPEDDALRVAARRQVKRVHRLKIHAAAWVLGTILITALWVLSEWQANGGFQHFGNEGNPGDWSPTLWALAIGVWGLVVGIMALRVSIERPTTEAEVDREVDRLKPSFSAADTATDAEFRRFARTRVEGIRRLEFHVAAWVLGMVVLTPLWVLIEWQDNGGFERWSDNGNPGDWEPTMLYIGAVWALVIAVLALRVFFDRPSTEAEVEREVERLKSRT